MTRTSLERFVGLFEHRHKYCSKKAVRLIVQKRRIIIENEFQSEAGHIQFGYGLQSTRVQ